MSVARYGGRGLRTARPGPERLVIDLRSHLSALSDPPELPPGWHLEVAHSIADDAPFGGDFAVSARTADDARLEIVLVDVSGKGIDAGTRALMLAGAVSGILGAVPPAEVLPAVNSHLLRQGWTDGFATGLHVAVDFASGEFDLYVGGHPAPAQFHAGRGDWELLDGRGPLLGMQEGGSWPAVSGLLRPGDALLTYTDGCVERSREDIDVGIDRLLGSAYKQVLIGFAGGAERLIAGVGDSRDDRAVAWLWRDPVG